MKVLLILLTIIIVWFYCTQPRVVNICVLFLLAYMRDINSYVFNITQTLHQLVLIANKRSKANLNWAK